jgi:hypothetical protein
MKKVDHILWGPFPQVSSRIGGHSCEGEFLYNKVVLGIKPGQAPMEEMS